LGFGFVNHARAVFVFVSVKTELVNSPHGGFKNAALGDLGLHFWHVLGVEHDQCDGGKWEVVVYGDTLFNEGEGLARTGDGVDDKVTSGFVDEVNTRELFGCAVGRERGGCGKWEV